MTIAGRNSTDIQLGDIVRDRITGFEGVAIGVTHYLSQCDQWCIKPQELKDGRPIDGLWFDVTHVEVVTAGAYAYLAPVPERQEVKTGGPSPAPMPRR